MYNIILCNSADKIKRCYPVIQQLHEQLCLEEYFCTTRRLMETGYMIVALEVDGAIVSVAGFHFGESFAWKKYLYIDDLVTDKNSRSNGFGEKMLSWLQEYAIQNNCNQLHLDSRVIRHAAHKFDINQGLVQGGYHFHKHL